MKDLKGIKVLNKEEQKSINGGGKICGYCGPGRCCDNGFCIRCYIH